MSWLRCWSSNAVVAAATVTLIGLTYFEIRYLAEQNEVIVGQTEEMAKQTAAAIKGNEALVKQTESAEEQIKQMRLEQRAWIRIANPMLEKFRENEPMQCKAVIINSGHTPGTITGMALTFDFVPNNNKTIEQVAYDLDVITDGKKSEPTEIVVPPDSPMRLPIPSKVVTSEMLRQLSEDKGEVWLMGRVEYTDNTGAKRLTKFCLKTDRDGGEGKELAFHHQYNQMD